MLINLRRYGIAKVIYITKVRTHIRLSKWPDSANRWYADLVTYTERQQGQVNRPLTVEAM